MNIPSNYRQLAPNETIRPYDRYLRGRGECNYVAASIGSTPETHNRNFGAYGYTYWRRTHKKTQTVVRKGRKS